MLGTVVEKAAFQDTGDRNKDGFLSLSELQNVGESFMAALIHCRHRVGIFISQQLENYFFSFFNIFKLPSNRY